MSILSNCKHPKNVTSVIIFLWIETLTVETKAAYNKVYWQSKQLLLVHYIVVHFNIGVYNNWCMHGHQDDYLHKLKP